MMKKHIVTKLHESSGKDPKDISLTAVYQAELKQKKNEYEMNNYFNQGLIDMKKVKQILSHAEKRSNQFEGTLCDNSGKVQNDIKKQEDRLEVRIKQRKMRSENGSVKKSKVDSRGQDSPRNFDSRMEYF